MEKTIEIPEGYKARIEGNKVILEPKENEDRAFIELIKGILHFHHKNGIFDTTGIKYFGGRLVKDQEILAWLEKQATLQVRTGIEWVNTIDDACDKRYAEEYAHGEYCHEQSFRWGFFEGVEWLEKQNEQKSNPYSGTSFEYNGHTWGMCARDNGVDILLDKHLFKHLEIQGEQKTDKVGLESDIEKGKWYVCDIPRYTDFVVGKAYYCYKNGMLKPNENGMARYVARHCFHPWTIQDAKDGDVLATDTSVFIYAEVLYNKPYAYCGVDKFGVFKDNCRKNDWTNSVDNVYPATKEQRDLLFQKMKEAEYEWDADKKELKKIAVPMFKVGDVVMDKEDGDILTIREITKDKYIYTDNNFDWIKDQNVLELVQNPAWSEEDEIMFEFWNLYYEYKVGDMPNKDVVENLEKFRDWLKSLKNRVQPQSKQEWSEEDEKMFISLKTLLNDASCYSCTEGADKILSWLKSLKERYTWKPSDEQLEALEHSLGDYNIVIFEDRHKILTSLYQDLKKRKG